MVAGEGHLERVESQVDVRPILVTAGCNVPLHHVHRMLRHLAAVVTGAGPVTVGSLADHFAPFFERFKDDGDVEFLSECILDPNLNIVKVDKDS